MKVALVVGNGYAGQRHGRALERLGYEVKFYDKRSDRSDFSNFVSAMRIDPGVVVFACTPRNRIRSLSYYSSVLKGRKIVLEKPPCRPCDVDDYRRYGAMLDLYPVHNYYYMPIRTPEDGERWLIKIVRDKPHKSWYCDHDLCGGGILLDHGYHYLYVMLKHGVDIRPVLARTDDVPDMEALVQGRNYLMTLTWRGDKRVTDVNGSVFEPRACVMEESIFEFLRDVVEGDLETFDASVKVMETIKEVYRCRLK